MTRPMCRACPTREMPTHYASGFLGREKTLKHVPEKWTLLGYAPNPQTRWQRFRWHVGQGLIMNYPVLDVIGFSLRGLFWKMETKR